MKVDAGQEHKVHHGVNEPFAGIIQAAKETHKWAAYRSAHAVSAGL